jgi:hypothetical protein
MGTIPQKWSGQRVVLKRGFDSDHLAARDGYTVEEEYYTLGDDRIVRKQDYFLINVTTRTQQRGWIRIQVKIPVVYGDPWEEDLKREIEGELKSNHDLIGVFLSDIDQGWCRGFELSWEEKNE